MCNVVVQATNIIEKGDYKELKFIVCEYICLKRLIQFEIRTLIEDEIK